MGRTIFIQCFPFINLTQTLTDSISSIVNQNDLHSTLDCEQISLSCLVVMAVAVDRLPTTMRELMMAKLAGSSQDCSDCARL